MADDVPLVHGASKARRFFDRLAPSYDRINARIYKPEWREKVRAALRGRVLDVGVGTGFTTGDLEGAVGLDLSWEMLRRAHYAGELVRGNFLSPPLRAKTFDTIVFAGSFYYLDDPMEGLRIARHLLRDGGRVVLLSPATRWLALAFTVYSDQDYRALFDSTGFTRESYERLNWAACLVIARKR
jgi:SAM-dependent methyltransferase